MVRLAPIRECSGGCGRRKRSWRELWTCRSCQGDVLARVRGGEFRAAQLANQERLRRERETPEPPAAAAVLMLDPAWTPAAGYGHAAGLLALLAREGGEA
jgi:hypothetical protein